MSDPITPAPATKTSEKRVGPYTAKVVATGLLIYLLAIGLYAVFSYASTRSKLLTYGLSEATANLLGLATMLVALGLPALAILRIAFWRPKVLDYAAAMCLPVLTWGIAQIPANFDAVTGESLKYCASRPDGTTFCLDRPGIDPITQRKLIAIDGGAAEEQFRRDKDLLPRKLTTPANEIAFFDPLSGNPRVWVSKNESGCYDLFNNPGVNPYDGEKLEPVTRAIVQTIRKCSTKQAPPQQKLTSASTSGPPSVAPESSRPSVPLSSLTPRDQSSNDQRAKEATQHRAIEEAELQRIAAARAKEQAERTNLIEATTKGNLSEFCASLLRTCESAQCLSVRTVYESACVRDCGKTSTAWAPAGCLEKACSFESTDLRTRGVLSHINVQPDRGIGPPGCIGFRPDGRGSSDGAECLRRFLGEGYYVNARACSQDGFAYNVRLR